jgi:hypothetical protein
MDELARPRRGRPRTVVALPVDAEQARSDAQDDAGDGETAETGSGAPAIDAGPRQELDGHGVTFEKLCELVEKANRHDRRISCVYHPEANVSSFETPKHGGIRCVKGPIGYQLSDGTLIDGHYFYNAAP